MDPENRRKFNSWAIEKSFTQEIENKPVTIRSNNISEFVIEIWNEKKKLIPTIKSLWFPQYKERVEVAIFACNKINQRKGLIYILEYKIPGVDDYCSELKKEYNLSDVQKANWIKT